MCPRGDGRGWCAFGARSAPAPSLGSLARSAYGRQVVTSHQRVDPSNSPSGSSRMRATPYPHVEGGEAADGEGIEMEAVLQAGEGEPVPFAGLAAGGRSPARVESAAGAVAA